MKRIVLTIPSEGVMGYSPESLLEVVKRALYDWRGVGEPDPFIESARLEDAPPKAEHDARRGA